MKKKYPCQNLDLKDIKGECWEDIPGAVRLFQGFKFWGIKRLEFELHHDNRITYRRQEKILLTLKSCLLSILHSQTFLHVSNKTVCPVKPTRFL